MHLTLLESLVVIKIHAKLEQLAYQSKAVYASEVQAIPRY